MTFDKNRGLRKAAMATVVAGAVLGAAALPAAARDFVSFGFGAPSYYRYGPGYSYGPGYGYGPSYSYGPSYYAPSYGYSYYAPPAYYYPPPAPVYGGPAVNFGFHFR
jgi:hypothetical protein